MLYLKVIRFKINDKEQSQNHMVIFPSYANHSDIARYYLSNDNIQITEAGFLCGKLINDDTKIKLFGNSVTLGLSIDENNKHDDLNNYNWFAKLVDDDHSNRKEVVLYSTTDIIFIKNEVSKQSDDIVQCDSLYWNVEDADKDNLGAVRSYLFFDSKAEAKSNNFDKENIVFLKTVF